MRGEYFIALVFLVLIIPNATALESGMCVNAAITSVSPASVEPNQDFIVGIEIDNCGQQNQIPNNISFQITRFSSDISIKEPLTNDIGKLGFANSKRFITYHMRTSQNPIPGEHFFEAKLIYGDNNAYVTKDYNFSVTIESNQPELAISGIKSSPEKITSNQDIILTLKVQNDGKGDAKDVRVKLEGLNFEGVKEAYLGEIKANEELPARFVLKSGSSGENDFNIKVYYEFAGDNKMVQFPSSLQVFYELNSLYWIIPLIILILVLAFIYIIKVKARKEDGEE